MGALNPKTQGKWYLCIICSFHVVSMINVLTISKYIERDLP